MNLFNSESNSFFRISMSQNNSALGFSNAWSMLQSRDSTYWFGYIQGGLDKVIFEWVNGLPRVKETHNYKLQTMKNSGVVANTVRNTIFEDSNGKIWSGNYSAGLLYYDKDSDVLKTTTLEGQWPIPLIYSIEEEDGGNLWISCLDGIIQYKKDEKRYQLYGQKEGVFSRFYARNSVQKIGDDVIFGGEGGLYILKDSLAIDQEVPDPIITNISILGQNRLFNKPVPDLEEIELKYNENFLTFEFIGIDFHEWDWNRVFLFTGGMDGNWNYTNRQTEISYSNIPPGDYVLNVRSGSRDGSWSNPKKLIITILPPFWKTPWFLYY